MVCPLKPSGNLHGRERCQTAYSSPNLARDVSGRLLMGPPQSLCQSLCFGLIIEPTSIFFILTSPGLSRYMVQEG